MKTIINIMCITCILYTANAQDKRREPVKTTPMPNQRLAVPPARPAVSTAPLPNQKSMTEEQMKQQRSSHSNQKVTTPQSVTPNQRVKMVANPNLGAPVPEGTVIPQQAPRQPQPRVKDVNGNTKTK
jgi:hypothetical protein